MLNAFIGCIEEQMERKGFGKKRADEVIARFKGLAAHYRLAGAADPEMQAMQRAFAELHEEIAEKSKRAMVQLVKYGEHRDRFDDPATRNTAILRATNENLSPASIAQSFIEFDPRAGGLSYDTDRDMARGELWAIMSDVLERFSKGTMGVQRGKAHMTNIVHEVFGRDTSDVVAREIAAAWKKTSDAAVDLFNLAGGSMRKLADWRLPQGVSTAKVFQAGETAWVAHQKLWLDWPHMQWPDGRPILPNEQDEVLKAVYQTLSTDGMINIDPSAFSGNGRAIGNALEQHRFLHYKDAESWLANHQTYGDGSVFDVMSSHVDTMAHQIGLLRAFGPNPRQSAQTIRALAIKRGAEKGGREAAKVEAQLKNKFDPMLETILRENPMDSNSWFGSIVTGTANVITSALLGSVPLVAVQGDIMTTMAVRRLNKMSQTAGLLTVLKGIAVDGKFMREISAQSGFIMDEVISANYAMTRFTGPGTYGPAVTRRFADVVMRASGLSRWTSHMRWGAQMEFMGLMHRTKGDAFDKLPHQHVLRRYGITEDDWNVFRQTPTWSPPGRPNVKMLRPIDLATTRHDVFRKFHGMVLSESKLMVPDATVEAAVTLRGTSRPDTIHGAALHSFGMYKNFPVTFTNTFGRLAATQGARGGRLTFLAGFGTSLILGAALAMQLREMAKGNDPLPMDTASFWGKAALTSGGMSIWGDFLFSGVNSFGAGPGQTMAGPIAGFVGDALNLAAGDMFQWAAAMGTLNEFGDSKTLPRAVQFARRYTPGTSIWWARLALQRQIWDRLEEMADPKAYNKRQQRARRQQKTYGNESWWPAGARAPERGPEFEGALGQ